MTTISQLTRQLTRQLTMNHRELTEELRESHQRYAQKVNELLNRADANLAFCDQLIEELDIEELDK